ncbi:WD40 repeat-containing protein [Artemisia annua]|uniref:WD40 repeat-containing protein n=1 Tax=Artemisia annua TaxID=35608 RepID=A0A2U1PDK7_ARTAN|nr:WD40 repeat-containing protein [Artemisia annua]
MASASSSSKLRNLVWATSKNDIHLMSNYSIMRGSSLTQNLNGILNFFGHMPPTEVKQKMNGKRAASDLKSLQSQHALHLQDLHRRMSVWKKNAQARGWTQLKPHVEGMMTAIT